jgi:hypothetical protein
MPATRAAIDDFHPWKNTLAKRAAQPPVSIKPDPLAAPSSGET